MDFPDPEAQGHLEKHPNIHVINTAPDYWQARGRHPQTVERRQIENIKTAIEFARRDDIAWLGHFDNDEFLHVPSHANVGMRLARLDDDVMCARALPVEYLVPDDPDYIGPDQFKRLATPFARRRQISTRAYPEFGANFGWVSKPSGWKILFPRRARTDGTANYALPHQIWLHGWTNMIFIVCMTLILTPNEHSIFHSFQFDTGQMPHALTWG